MTTADQVPATLATLSTREADRLRLLALRYHIRADTTLRPVADVVYDLRSRHGLHLSMGQVIDLLCPEGSPVMTVTDAGRIRWTT
jgi:hypothetical protein